MPGTGADQEFFFCRNDRLPIELKAGNGGIQHQQALIRVVLPMILVAGPNTDITPLGHTAPPQHATQKTQCRPKQALGCIEYAKPAHAAFPC